MEVEISEEEYIRLSRSLTSKYPGIKVELLERDVALYDLGLADTIPCTVKIDVSDKEIEEICQYADDLEAGVCIYDNEVDSPVYNEYVEYGWLGNFFRKNRNT